MESCCALGSRRAAALATTRAPRHRARLSLISQRRPPSWVALAAAARPRPRRGLRRARLGATRIRAGAGPCVSPPSAAPALPCCGARQSSVVAATAADPWHYSTANAGRPLPSRAAPAAHRKVFNLRMWRQRAKRGTVSLARRSSTPLSLRPCAATLTRRTLLRVHLRLPISCCSDNGRKQSSKQEKQSKEERSGTLVVIRPVRASASALSAVRRHQRAGRRATRGCTMGAAPQANVSHKAAALPLLSPGLCPARSSDLTAVRAYLVCSKTDAEPAADGSAEASEKADEKTGDDDGRSRRGRDGDRRERGRGRSRGKTSR